MRLNSIYVTFGRPVDSKVGYADLAPDQMLEGSPERDELCHCVEVNFFITTMFEEVKWSKRECT